MTSQTRFLIIYETGGTWEMPLALFLQYEDYAAKRAKQDIPDCYSITLLEEWYNSLPTEDQEKVVKQ